MLQRIGNYELVRPLGAGGMAQTFVAIRRGPAGFEQKVCLKRILPQYASDPALVEQFLDEAKLLAHLRHANVVQVYDFGEADGSYFMALELIDGADLEALQRFLYGQRACLPESIALHVVSETLKALYYAHNAQLDGEPLHLVHRDVSPSNILLSRAGEVKLADFGIAKSRHRRHQTRAGHTKGKVAYMSPEQVRGDELDARSDLFAVGIVLHELLTGMHPFDADTDLTVLSNVLSGKRPSLATLTPDLRPELALLIDSLLEVDPARRPQSAADALTLVPALDNRFKIERQIEGLVGACLTAADAHSRGPSPRHVPDDGQTVDLPPSSFLQTPASARGQVAPERRFGSADQETAELVTPSVETLGTDALRKVDLQRGSRRGAWLAGVVLALVLFGAWLGLRPRRAPEVVVSAPPVQVPPTAEVGGQDAAAEETRSPAAARPTVPTKPQDVASGPDTAPRQPERAPAVHTPAAEVESASRPRRSHRSATRAAREDARHQPAAAVAPNAAPAEVAPKPASPPSGSPRRTNVQLSDDDF